MKYLLGTILWWLDFPFQAVGNFLPAHKIRRVIVSLKLLQTILGNLGTPKFNSKWYISICEAKNKELALVKPGEIFPFLPRQPGIPELHT